LRDLAFASVVALLLVLPVLAAPLYKCEVDGALAFQDTPCPPIKAKQKVACADVNGFAVYQDTLEKTCVNLPAGAATANDMSADTKPKAVTTKTTSKATTRKNATGKTAKEVLVRGYTKEDGTKVPSYTRSLPGEKRPE
jgi:hypothetical protein